MSEKIKDLIKQIGGSDELAKQLLEELGSYKTKVSEDFAKEYQAKAQKAKQVCIEEVAKEKSRLAHKLEVFMESKASAIERAATKQRAIEESAAIVQLRKVKNILGAVDGNSAELQALNRKLVRLSESSVTLKEERDRAVERANKANSIAANAIRKYRLADGKVVAEAKTSPKVEAKTITEELESARVPKAQAKTSSQPVAGAKPEPVMARVSGAMTPEEIAASISVD